MRFTFIFLLLVIARIVSAQTAPERLNAAVSSITESELLPVVSADGTTLYFSRPRIGSGGENDVVLDVWRSIRDENGDFSSAEVMGGNLGSRFGIAVTSVSPDNNTLYLIGKLQRNTPPEERVYQSHRTATGWSKPTPIRIRNLNVRGTTTDYSFGPDQKTLIMALNRDSSLGEADLFVSFLDEQKYEWTTPLWLGARVNSASFEMTPTLAADNRTLFFSSTRPGGYGAVDVYKCVRLDDSWTKWSQPENLGREINSNGRTTYYTEDAAGKFAYFVWRPDAYSNADIYRIAIAKRSSLPLLVTGIVRDNSGKPLEAMIRYERLRDGRSLGFARTDPATGSYRIVLPAGETYGIHAEKENHIPVSERISVAAENLEESRTLDLTLVALAEQAVIVLNNILFEVDNAELLPESFTELDRLKMILEKHPVVEVSIEGHTDSSGSAQHNIALSESRAQSVRSYLIAKGISPTRLTAKGYGMARPVSANSDEQSKALNRRVEFRITKQQQ